MFDEKTEMKINEAVSLELVRACKVYGADYHSLHEGYAVLLDEVEEAENELTYIKNHLAMMWDSVKVDDSAEVKSNARIVALDAVNLAKEAAQIAAVAKKIIGSFDNA